MAELVDAMATVFETDGVLPIDAAVARCIAAGTVDVVGVGPLAEAGVTAADPDGPDNDPYARLSREQIDWVVAVWSGCTDVAELVQRALLAGGPADIDPAITDCLGFGLSGGLAEAFLADALADETAPGGAMSDVLRLVDGCSIGAARAELEGVQPGLWPWLTVSLPGYESTLLTDEATAGLGVEGALAGGSGVYLEALEVSDADGQFAAVLVVAGIDETLSGGIDTDIYAANIIGSAGDSEVFPIELPGGANVVGWEDVDNEVVYLVWTGRRVVVFATGPIATADVLSLYAELVPAP
ncbi:MAG: hypothetical protein KDB16_14995 [Acidimicrobiales bacterium]|nr:hypothetical protein [Acidimicrobiales bacterium]